MSGQIWPDRSRFKDSWVCAVHVVTRWLPEEGEEMSGQIWPDWSRLLIQLGGCTTTTRGNKMAARRGRGDEWADPDRLEQI